MFCKHIYLNYNTATMVAINPRATTGVHFSAEDTLPLSSASKEIRKKQIN